MRERGGVRFGKPVAAKALDLLDDALRVELEVSAAGKASLTFAQRIVRLPDTVLSRAMVKIACLDKDSFRPVAIPANIREKLNHAHE